MPDVPIDAVDTGSDEDDADRKVVDHERAELRKFVEGLSPDDIKSGGWFTKLVAHALSSYTDKVTWRYLQGRFAGVPADAIVDQRITMAARYASIGGELTASAYTAAVSATIRSRGGASLLTISAALTTVMVDVAFADPTSASPGPRHRAPTRCRISRASSSAILRSAMVTSHVTRSSKCGCRLRPLRGSASLSSTPEQILWDLLEPLPADALDRLGCPEGQGGPRRLSSDACLERLRK